MPAYDFKCPSCEQVFEVNRSMSSREEEHCPVCGTAAKRVFNSVGVTFHGSGFYNTDNRPKPVSPESSCAAKTDAPACASCSSAEAGV